MDWRCANKRRQRAPEYYLGDIVGKAPPEPMRPVYRQRPESDWVVGWTHVVLAVIALATFVALIIAFLVLLFLYAAAKPALAHGPAEWIERGGYKNSVGELCCGKRDCDELADADVKVGAAGYYIVSIKETVPFSEATPSPDGKYWRCQWGGSRKCFFAPPGST